MPNNNAGLDYEGCLGFGCLLEILLVVGVVVLGCADSVVSVVAGGLILLAAMVGYWISSRAAR